MVVLSLGVRHAAYTDFVRRLITHQTTRLTGVPISQIEITPVADVVTRSDGLIDVQLVISAAPPHDVDVGLGLLDTPPPRDVQQTAAAPQQIAAAPSIAGGPADIVGTHSFADATEAAMRLVAYGAGRLSFELRVPVSFVAIVSSEADRPPEAPFSLPHAAISAAVALSLLLLLLAAWMRRVRALQRSARVPTGGGRHRPLGERALSCVELLAGGAASELSTRGGGSTPGGGGRGLPPSRNLALPSGETCAQRHGGGSSDRPSGSPSPRRRLPASALHPALIESGRGAEDGHGSDSESEVSSLVGSSSSPRLRAEPD